MSDRLLELVRGCVYDGEVVLSSGRKSDFYVDARAVTIDPEGSCLVGHAVVKRALALGVTVIGGPVIGACPMVSAAGVVVYQFGFDMKLFYVRGECKGHGLQKMIEGVSVGRGDRVLLVDDVITSGGSVVRVVENVRALGAVVVGVMVIVDRQAGGREVLDEIGVTLYSLFTRDELLSAE